VNRFFLHILFFFSFTSISIGQNQNFVYNGSFEEYSECPISNELGNGQFERAIGWFRPTDGSPDYFNQCNTYTVGVPNNFWGYQNAFHGHGYAGFIPVMDDKKLLYEYLRTQLILPLKPCVAYRFGMYVSLANYSTHGMKNIGAYFSQENNFQNNSNILEGNPQVKYTANPIVDTLTWTLVEGTFIAHGFEQYLTIGYFEKNIGDDTLFVQEMGSFYFHPYYYVDSVSLIEIGPVSDEICELGEIIFPNIITPNNDSSNDQLDATPYFALTEEITIMNRWGNVITVLTENNPSWNGTTQNGTPCSEGTYFYQFSYQWGNERKEKSGFIQLVR
jgi:gliding motility-associated-like protein